MKLIKKSTAAILAALLLLQLNNIICFTLPYVTVYADEELQTETVEESEIENPQLVINTKDWTNNTTPEIEWSGVYLDTENEIEIQYQINNGEWQDSDWISSAGSGMFEASQFATDCEYTIVIRGKAEIINAETGETVSIYTETSNEVEYKRDASMPIIDITSPKSAMEVNDTLKIVGSINDGGSGIGKWILEYESGDKPGVWGTIEQGISEIEKTQKIVVWDLSDLSDGFYTIRLTAYDNDADASVSSSSVTIQKISKSGLVTPINLKVALITDTDISAKISWESTQNLQSVKYNMYRCSDAELQNFELIASNIEDTYWVDSTILYGEEYYYKVSSISDGKESKASVETAEIKLDRMLGLEDYWTYADFETDKGRGYANLANGNLVYEVQDSIYTELLPGISFARVYNSQSAFISPLGYGWDFSFNVSLYQEKDNDNNLLGMILKDFDGSFHYFSYDNETGEYETLKGQSMELSYRNKTGEHTITNSNGMTYVFGDDLKITKILLSDDEYINFTYDEYGNMIAAENNFGERIVFDYYQQEDEEGLFYSNDKSHVGLLAQMTDINGKSYIYEYVKGQDILSMASLGTTSYRERYYYTDSYLLNNIFDTAKCCISIEYTEKESKISRVLIDDEMLYELTYEDEATYLTNINGETIEYIINDINNIKDEEIYKNIKDMK